MERLDCIVLKYSCTILIFFTFYFGNSHNNAFYQIDALLSISFEIVPVVNLIDCLRILKSIVYQFLNDFYTFLLELT